MRDNRKLRDNRGGGVYPPSTRLGCHQTCRLLWAMWVSFGLFGLLYVRAQASWGQNAPLPLFHVAEIKQELSLKLSPDGFVPLRHGTKQCFCGTGFGRCQQCRASRQSRRPPRVPQLSPLGTLGLKGSCGPPFYHAYRYVAGTVKRSVSSGSNQLLVRFRGVGPP